MRSVLVLSKSLMLTALVTGFVTPIVTPFMGQTHFAQAQPSHPADQRAKAFLELFGAAVQAQQFDEQVRLIALALNVVERIDEKLLPKAKSWYLGGLLGALGDAYRLHRSDNPSLNQENAVTAYRHAIAAFASGDYKELWSVTQINLGLALLQRRQGDASDNIEQAIDSFRNSLTVFTQVRFATDWARAQVNLGIALLSRKAGNRSDNLEQAITALQAAMTVYTEKKFPAHWGKAQDTLGLVYSARIVGERVANEAHAIKAFEDALKVRSRDRQPVEWARTQSHLADIYYRRRHGARAEDIDRAIAIWSNTLPVLHSSGQLHRWANTQVSLGIAYLNRRKGVGAENLELSIAAYRAALTVFSRSSSPAKWAQAQNNLGNAYARRIKGDKAENLEQAIAALENALAVRKQFGTPRTLALTQLNLGAAHIRRLRGNRAENVERAIAYYEEALTQITRRSAPIEWGQAQHNLAMAYRNRVLGSRADNIERAIKVYQGVLEVHTRQQFPTYWAMTHMNLGVAFQERLAGDRSQNIEQAIASFEQALAIYDRKTFPVQWGQVLHNLAGLYLKRLRGGNAQNIERAIGLYRQVLSEHTKDRQPWFWAMTQMDLATALQERSVGVREHNLSLAVAAYKDSLAVYRRDVWPARHMFAARRLGAVLLRQQRWAEAEAAYASARDAFLQLFGEGFDEAEAVSILQEAGPLFTEAAFSAAQQGKYRAALQHLSEGRARLLATKLRLQSLDLSSDEQRRLSALRDQVRSAQSKSLATKGAERVAAIDRLVAIRAAILSLVKQAELRVSNANQTEQVVDRLVADGAILVAPILTIAGGKLLVVAANKAGISYSAADLTADAGDRLNELIRGDSAGQLGGWLGAFNIQYLPEAQRKERIGEWYQSIGAIGGGLHSIISAPLGAELARRGLDTKKQLVWLPSGALGALPIGLAQDPATGRRLGDSYAITYAPSLDALAAARRVIATGQPASFAAVVNPTQDLDFTEIEAALIAGRFAGQHSTLLVGKAATIESVLKTLRGRRYWHFASHGTFSWTDARQSALLLAGRSPLTVGRLLDTRDLGGPRLVVLSACETGLYDLQNNPDEFVGMPATFIGLGAAGVLATLWQVDDRATALLIARFYELHLEQGLSPPAALKQAKNWLRQTTRGGFMAYLRQAAASGRIGDPALIIRLQEHLSRGGHSNPRFAPLWNWLAAKSGALMREMAGKADPDVRIFAHPYFWGGFIYTGL